VSFKIVVEVIVFGGPLDQPVNSKFQIFQREHIARHRVGTEILEHVRRDQVLELLARHGILTRISSWDDDGL
jgi:hypothetical protein